MAAASGKRERRDAGGAKCGAKTRGGGKCKRPAGAGTEHIGFGACKIHGGCTPSHQVAAANAQAQHLAAELDLEPHDALLWCVRSAAGQVAFLARKVAQLEETKIVVEHERHRVSEGEGSFSERTSHTELNVWVHAYQQALERLAKFSKMAVDAGVAERHVRVAERYGEVIARLLDGVLGDLDLTPAQLKRAPDVVRRHLTLVEGGVAA